MNTDEVNKLRNVFINLSIIKVQAIYVKKRIAIAILRNNISLIVQTYHPLIATKLKYLLIDRNNK